MHEVVSDVEMRTKFLPLVVALAAGALALTMATASQAGKGDIFGTDHDTGSPGNPTCAQCHTPHKAEGMYLWANVPYSAYTGESEILPLCFSCHDGSVASEGGYLPDVDHTHPQGIVMYDPTHDGDPVDAYPITEHAAYETSCKKCMEPDCVKCHDAHSNAWLFLDADRFPPIDTDGDDVPDTDMLNASLCASCHEGWRHGIESYDADHNPIPHTTHPEMITEPEGADDFSPPSGANRDWDGDAGDFNGTRLWDAAGTGVVMTGAADVRCMTCHALHGGQNEELTAMATSTDTDSHAPICENCHE